MMYNLIDFMYKIFNKFIKRGFKPSSPTDIFYFYVDISYGIYFYFNK